MAKHEEILSEIYGLYVLVSLVGYVSSTGGWSIFFGIVGLLYVLIGAITGIDHWLERRR